MLGWSERHCVVPENQCEERGFLKLPSAYWPHGGPCAACSGDWVKEPKALLSLAYVRTATKQPGPRAALIRHGGADQPKGVQLCAPLSGPGLGGRNNRLNEQAKSLCQSLGFGPCLYVEGKHVREDSTTDRPPGIGPKAAPWGRPGPKYKGNVTAPLDSPEPERLFWAEQAPSAFGLDERRRPKIGETSHSRARQPTSRSNWFEDGRSSTSPINCIDRHLHKGAPTRPRSSGKATIPRKSKAHHLQGAARRKSAGWPTSWRTRQRSKKGDSAFTIYNLPMIFRESGLCDCWPARGSAPSISVVFAGFSGRTAPRPAYQTTANPRSSSPRTKGLRGGKEGCSLEGPMSTTPSARPKGPTAVDWVARGFKADRRQGSTMNPEPADLWYHDAAAADGDDGVAPGPEHMQRRGSAVHPLYVGLEPASPKGRAAHVSPAISSSPRLTHQYVFDYHERRTSTGAPPTSAGVTGHSYILYGAAGRTALTTLDVRGPCRTIRIIRVSGNVIRQAQGQHLLQPRQPAIRALMQSGDEAGKEDVARASLRLPRLGRRAHQSGKPGSGYPPAVRRRRAFARSSTPGGRPRPGGIFDHPRVPGATKLNSRGSATQAVPSVVVPEIVPMPTARCWTGETSGNFCGLTTFPGPGQDGANRLWRSTPRFEQTLLLDLTRANTFHRRWLAGATADGLLLDHPGRPSTTSSTSPAHRMGTRGRSRSALVAP